MAAAPAVFRVAPELTSAEFSVTRLGFTRQIGRFRRIAGVIVLDPEGHSGSIELTIDADSVDTGWRLRDAFLTGEHMFDAVRYPLVRYRSTELTFDGPTLIGIAGELQMHNVVRAIQLKIIRLDCGSGRSDAADRCSAEVVASIKRSDFGMDFALGLIGDRIDLGFRLTALRVEPSAAMQSP